MFFSRRKYRRANARAYWRFSACLISLSLYALLSDSVLLRPTHAAPLNDGSARQRWEFPANLSAESPPDQPELIRLPTPDLIRLPSVSEPPTMAAESSTSEQLLIARLSPPQPIDAAKPEFSSPQTAQRTPEPAAAPPPERLATRSIMAKPIRIAQLPALQQLSEQERLLKSVLEESATATTGVPTDGRIDELAKTKIQNAYSLASRGSLFVARKELIEVLRMVSQAKDSHQGTGERTQALAAGLRALREAEDFVPEGTQLEADLEIEVLCASHRTPIAKQAATREMLPSQLMSLYLRYAQLKLAMSVAGEPAGSMALHALGKLDRQLGLAEAGQDPLAERRAIAYQQAALLAHNQNHLAAHELGVLLANSGHYAEANQLFLQVSSREPNAVVFRNLARVQEKLGQQTQALANRDQAQQLVQQGATGTHNVEWVSPEQFAKSRVQTPRYTTAQLTTTSTASGQQVPLPGSRQPSRPSSRR